MSEPEPNSPASQIQAFFQGLIRGADAVRKATSYTDYIAHRIAVDLAHPDRERIITWSGPVRHDRHPKDGYSISTTKTVDVTDHNGNKYRVTIEDLRP